MAMNLKARLQRVLQIVEDAERTGELSLLEKDIALNELREAYAELKFGEAENEEQETVNEEQKTETAPNAPTAPIATIEDEQIEDEPEVEVELIFDEESEETATEGEQATDEQKTETAPNTPNALIAPIAEESKESEVQEELSSFVPFHSSKKQSPLLSLYDDEPVAVIGEQFHENPSVADSIAIPKGVAETPISSLRAAIGVADRYMLVRELFDGDTDAYEAAIDALESQVSFDDCVIHIAENYSWRPQSDGTKAIMSLLRRKFNA